MALPLKSGADLYNQQAIRMRLHNLGADPTEVGKGLIYFNTNTDTNGSNHALHACVHDGTSFKALAYLDDVANNEAFQELETRVKYLEGDLDVTDTINNLKDLEAFLAGFYESNGSLMEYLNTELGKKLDTSGGTITGNLTINQYLQIKAWEGYGSGSAKLWYDGNKKELQWQDVSNILIGNNSILTSAGGTITSSSHEALVINRTGGTPPYLSFNSDGVTLGRVGFDVTSKELIASIKGATQTLLHSGNVGEYAVEQVPSSYYLDLSQNYTGQTAKVFSYFQRIGTETDMSGNIGSARKGVIRMSGGGSESQLLFDHYNGDLYYRNYKTAWSDWKQIAFTDSDITGYAAGLKHSNGTIGAIINSSGNVLIGTTEDNGSGARLQVAGKIFSSITTATDNYAQISNATNTLRMGVLNSGRTFIHSVGNYHLSLGTNDTERIRITDGGNVGIGISSPAYKLDVNGDTRINGDLHVTGNIIADGEVSAGGAGEEGGGSSSGGGGAFHSEGIGVGATQTTIAHGLGTDDIVVSIYEKDGVSGRWSIILTDVEIVDANNIIVSFGSATTVEHKVVIMGAVA